MPVQLDIWQLVSLAITALGASAAGGKLLLMQTQRHLDQRFDAQERRLDDLDKARSKEADRWHQVERELLTLKADLPMQYVRREDYVRGQSVLEAKLDALGSKLETAQLRAASGGIDATR
ncbi:hypothetical protein [Ottowia sp.]|uniref:hypothetical protein n=1 Tax=Ottowia sp. TaxID=1898956 RepID=UPI003A89C22D